MFKILKNRNFILPLAFFMGLVFPNLAQYSKPFTISALALVMAISLIDISTNSMLEWKESTRPIMIGIILNYVILGAVIVLFTYLLIPERSLQMGMILVAASPPGVAIMPFSAILSGNMIFSLFATFGAYLAAIIITPLITILFTGAREFPFSSLALNLFYLIILPIIFSRFMRTKKIFSFLKSWRGTIVNWGLFVVIFTVIGINQVSFFTDLDNLLRIAFIALLTTFPLFYLLKVIFRGLAIKKSDAITMMLLGTIKNAGFASALAMSLFSDSSSSIPGAIVSAVYALYMIWLGTNE
jgi:BASS family bile acid:Na+ symporter